jgi:HK97 family phage major capsid protein
MITELVKKRAAAFDQFKALADKPILTDEERTDYPVRQQAVRDLDDQITRARAAQEMAAVTAQPVEGQEPHVRASVKPDAYERDRSLVVGGAMKMLGRGGGIVQIARQESIALYGENHPVTRALVTSAGAAGGFIVPPDYMTDIIELLRPLAVVRGAGPRVIPMPRGTMTLPGQASAATASYGSEGAKIASSQQTLNQIVASFKKLTALVPVSNDMMRYADPAVDAFVRDDLVKVIALTEDLNFILGTGAQDTPRGFLSFANSYAAANGGSAGAFSTTGNSTAASGGNFLTSTSSYTWRRWRRNSAAPSTSWTRPTCRTSSAPGSCTRARTTTSTTCRTRSASTSTATS